MKIQSVQGINPSFTGDRRKFDVQGHVGEMYDGIHNKTFNYTAQNIIDTVEINNVKKVLVTSVSGLNAEGSDKFMSELNAAQEIQRIAGNGNVKLYPLFSCQPGISKGVSVAENILQTGNFVGMKFHPTNTEKAIKDNFDAYAAYMSLAEDKAMPCVFHSVTDGKSDPVQIIRLAERHKKLPVVLYHIDLMSTPEQLMKTIDNISESVKAGKSNLFVDVSWLTGLWDNAEQNKNVIKHALDKIGPDRILFGSDTPIAEMGDKEKYGKFADFIEETVKEFYNGKPQEAESALNKIFYDNAEGIFINKSWYEKPVQQTQQTVKKALPKKGMMILGGAVVLGLIAFAAKAINANAKQTKANENNPSRVVNK